MICDVIINDPNISDVQRQKELEYKRYVQSHIANVSAAWDRMRNIDTIIDFACVEGGIMHSTLIPIMDMYISQHDASKYSTDEWEPYRMMYFSVDDAEKATAQSSYNMAEQHHYMHNMHHPEFWKSLTLAAMSPMLSAADRTAARTASFPITARFIPAAVNLEAFPPQTSIQSVLLPPASASSSPASGIPLFSETVSITPFFFASSSGMFPTGLL